MFVSVCGKTPADLGAAFVAENATVAGDVITLRGMWADARGRLHRGVVSGSRKEGPALAAALALKLKEAAQCAVK